MSGSVVVRRAGLDDVDAAASLFASYRVFYGRTHDVHVAAAFLRARLTAEESVVLLGEVESLGPVGFVQLYPTFESIEVAPLWVLNDLFVAETARGRGVGTALVRAAERTARAGGAASISLQTAHTNTTAQRLYEREGWTLDTTYRGYEKALE